MLCLIFILKNENIIYQYQFGDTLEESYLYDLYNLIRIDIDENVKHEEYFKYRTSYVADRNLNLVFIFLTSLGIRINKLNRPPKSKSEELRDDIDRMIKEAEDLRKKIFQF